MSQDDDEIIAAIVADLKPWQSHWTKAKIQSAVADQVQALQGATDEFFSRDAVVRTRSEARDINGTIRKLQRQLARASPELKMRFSHHEKELTAELVAAQDECRKAIASSLKEGRSDQVKEWCARVAFSLIVKYSTRTPSSGSSSAPFRNIAGLIYARVRGGRGNPPDLKRACDELLRTMRQAVQFNPKKSSDL